MIDPETTERLIAYHDGELTSAERTDIEQLVARDEQARQFLAEMKRNDAMIALADTIDVPEGYWDSFNERLMGRILRREARRKADRRDRRDDGARPRGWRRWFGPLQMAAAVVLAATVALQVGVHLGGSRTPTPARTPVAHVPAANSEWERLREMPSVVYRTSGKGALQPQQVRPLSAAELNNILMSTEDVLTPLANGQVARPEELKAYQVILVTTGLLPQIDAARNNTPSEARVLYVLNNTYDLLDRAAKAEPAKARTVAIRLQNDVNTLGLLEATQELIRDNRDLAARSVDASAK